MKAFKALWDAEATLGTIPLCHGRVETGPDAPYATIVVAVGEKEFDTRASMEHYLVSLRVYGGPLLSDAGTYHSKMTTIYDRQKNISGITGFIQCFAAEDSIDEDPYRKNAQDVLVATGTWDVMLQQSRGP